MNNNKSSQLLNLDVLVYAFLFITGAFLLSNISGVGLYSDDYWIIHDLTTTPFIPYVEEYLSSVNSRYLYPFLYKLMVSLFYDPSDVFGTNFTRIIHIFGGLIHLLNCFLLYRVLTKIGVYKGVFLLLIPALVFPVFGKQAVFWFTAYFVHVFGLTCLLVAALFYLNRNRLGVVIAGFIGLGCSEFLIVPFALLFLLFAWEKWLNVHIDGLVRRIQTSIVYASPILAPLAFYFFIFLMVDGSRSRIDKVGDWSDWGFPSLFIDPFGFLISLFIKWAVDLQPFEFLRSYPLVTLSFIALMLVGANSKQAFIRFAILLSFYFGSFLPMAVVGYAPFHSRLLYIPGVICLAIFAVLISDCLGRFLNKNQIQQHQSKILLAIAPIVLAASYFLGATIHSISKEADTSYNCLKSFANHVDELTEGRAPKNIDVCGMPRSINEFQIVNNGYTLPYLFALKYGLPEQLPVASLTECPSFAKPFWTPENCPVNLYFYINNGTDLDN